MYECAGLGDKGGEQTRSDEDDWQIASCRGIQSVFRDDLIRATRFRQYLEAKHTGLLLARGGKWIAYGWISPPGGSNPPHLPRWTGTLEAPWIFGCHTREGYRRQGIYKRLLARLVGLATQEGISTKIYIDTHADNIPSRLAIVGAGFRPVGIFSTYRFWTPVAGTRIVGGRWRIEQPHPELPSRPFDMPIPAISGGMSYKNYAG